MCFRQRPHHLQIDTLPFYLTHTFVSSSQKCPAPYRPLPPPLTTAPSRRSPQHYCRNWPRAHGPLYVLLQDVRRQERSLQHDTTHARGRGTRRTCAEGPTKEEEGCEEFKELEREKIQTGHQGQEPGMTCLDIRFFLVTHTGPSFIIPFACLFCLRQNSSCCACFFVTRMTSKLR